MTRANRWTMALSVAAVLTAVLTVPWGGDESPRPGAGLAYAAAPVAVLPEMMTKKTVKAIDRGLKYLVKTQRADGSWAHSGSYGNYPAVMTSLAGIALLGSGSTPETGPYYKNTKKAMLYILRIGEAGKDGLIAGPGGESRSMYGHGFSMLFLAQCYGMDLNKDISKRMRKVLNAAVKLTARAQSDLGKAHGHAGGWIYTPTSRGDEGSVTVTQLQALRACRNVGIKVPKSTIDRAVAYLKYCQQGDGGICYSARSRGSSRPPISAAAIACFYAAGIYDRGVGGPKTKEAKMVERLVAYCKRTIQVTRSGGHYFYTHMYMAEAMYMRGGKDWKSYYPQIRDRLLGMQNLDGSWMGDSVGATYGTSIATLILQLPYGYLPICQR